MGFNPANGQFVENALFEQALSAQGRLVSIEFVVPVDQSHGQPELHLELENSGLLNTYRSRFTVFVDDRPRGSFRLNQAGRGVRVKLKEEPGFQRVSIEASLVIDNDSCLTNHPEGAWLTILESSKYRYRKKKTSPSSQLLAKVSDLPAAWEPSSAVHIEYFGSETEGSLISQIDWDHHFRGWNFTPSSRGDTARYSVRLYETGHSEIPDSLDNELNEHPDVQAVMRLNGDVLHVVANSPKSISRAALMLADFRARDLCVTTLCKLGPEFLPGIRPQISEKSDPWAARLSELGYPDGWTAKGNGTSTLRLFWERPPWWELLRYPELRLQVRKSGTGSWREDLPALSIRINGQPIASFSLSEVESNLANVTARIPSHFWEAPGWSIEIDAHLEQDTNSCSFTNNEHNWLVIEPVSGLHIPRKETEFDGISDLFINGEKPPTLTGDLQLARQDVVLTSKLLYPFRPWVNTSFSWNEECRGSCLQFVNAGKLEAPDQISLDDGQHSLDKEGDLRIPVLATSNSVQILRKESRYLVGIPVSATSELAIPDYRALKSAYAIHYDEKWIGIESASAGESQIQIGEAQAVAGVQSDQGQQLRLIHLFIGLLLVLVLIAGAIWLWRGYRLYNREELDGKNVEHFG